MANRTNGWKTLTENIDQTEVKVSVQTAGRNAGVTAVRYHTPDGWRLILIDATGETIVTNSGPTRESIKPDWNNLQSLFEFYIDDDEDDTES